MTRVAEGSIVIIACVIALTIIVALAKMDMEAQASEPIIIRETITRFDFYYAHAAAGCSSRRDLSYDKVARRAYSIAKLMEKERRERE